MSDNELIPDNVPDEFANKYEDEDKEYIEETEIKNYLQYKDLFTEDIFFAGNGFSINFNSKFNQEQFKFPVLEWRKITLLTIVEFLLEDKNIVKEDMWKDFTKVLHLLFRESFVYPILEAHIDLYDKQKINEYKKKLKVYKEIYTLNYDLLLPWTKLENISYLHGNINIMFTNDKVEKKHLHDFEINIHNDFTQSTLDKIVKLRKDTNIKLTEVYGGHHYEKLYQIDSDEFLKKEFESLNNISGTLILFGCSIHNNDKHIWGEIDSNTKIERVLISVYEESEINDIRCQVQEYFSELHKAGKIDYFHATSFFEEK